MTELEHSPAPAGTSAKLSGVTKAAILLVNLGEEASAPIIRLLSDEELKKVTRAVASLQVVTPQQSAEVLESFQQVVAAGEYLQRGGSDYARKMLASAFGPEANRLVGEFDLGNVADSGGAQPLHHTDPEQLLILIRNEHPQTVAIILAHLKQSQASTLLAKLPREFRKDVAMRMASLDQVPPMVIRRISEVLTSKVRALGSISKEPVGGARAVAEILNRMNSADAEELLGDVANEKADLEQSIRHFMFVFEDLMKIDSKGMREIVAKVDRKVLALAMKGTSEDMRNHILACMSQRGAEMMREDIQAMGPVRIRDVEGAQQQVISAIRILQAEGTVSMGEGGDDQYVN